MEIDHGTYVLAPEVTLATTELAACVIGVRHSRDGQYSYVATGDNSVSVFPVAAGNAIAETASLDLGALPISLCPDSDSEHVLIGGEDGGLRRVGFDGDVDFVSRSGGGWVDNAISHPVTGHRAWSVGRTLHVVDRDGAAVACFAGLESTPAGLCFSPDGGQLAVARYNGVTLWNIAAGAAPTELLWRGSHTAVSWSPDGRYIVTATQDRDLHCWRLSDGRDFRMSGYPSKIRSIGWTASSSYICASGADTVTSWYCDETGPGGKPALELGFVYNGTVMQVAPHPANDIVAAGYDDGTVLIGDIVAGDALIAKPPGGGPVSSIDWAPDGLSLAVGTRGGVYASIHLDSPIS